MNKSTLLTWLDLGLFALLGLTVLASTVEIFFHFFVHVLLGLTLSAGALIHVVLHWDWIKNAFSRLGKLPAAVRSNFWLDLALFSAYTACGLMGLTARTFWLLFPPLHWVLGFLHICLALGVITLQIIHLARHWKWLTASLRRMLGLSPSRQGGVGG